MNASPPRSPDPRVQRVVSFYEQLREADLPSLDQLYAAEARFKDPFNEVRGVPALRAIYAHMFRTLHDPRFVVHDVVAQGDDCFLTWDLHFATQRGDPMRIHGATLLRFDADGRVAEHRDYWDAAEELYEKLPMLGTLMRWLKRRAAG